MACSLQSETENTMSNNISALLLRNLSDVFGENDPVRRRAAIDEIFHEDAVFYDPKGGIFRGRDKIDRIAGVIKATHPDFRSISFSTVFLKRILQRSIGSPCFHNPGPRAQLPASAVDILTGGAPKFRE